MKHTYHHFQTHHSKTEPCHRVCCLCCGRSRCCRSVWGGSANLIKVGIMRACRAAGVMLRSLAVAYRFTLISPVLTQTQPHRSILLYSIDELLKACSKIGSNFSCITLYIRLPTRQYSVGFYVLVHLRKNRFGFSLFT